jgi:hypothetical protein
MVLIMSHDARCQLQPLFRSADELNSQENMFVDKSRRPDDNRGPYIVVCDDFYEDPMRIRRDARKKQFAVYSPPTVQIFGRKIAEEYARRHPGHLQGKWYSTVVEVFMGNKAQHPFCPEKNDPPGLRERVSQVICEKIPRDTWLILGDGWNCEFHLQDADWQSGRGSIHHHYKSGDIDQRGWSGVVYLSPDAPPSAGTSIWREKKSGLCIAGFGAKFDWDTSNFDLALLVENKFNRMVLFRENVLHRGEHGFGEGKDARLTQTLFFRSCR